MLCRLSALKRKIDESNGMAMETSFWQDRNRTLLDLGTEGWEIWPGRFLGGSDELWIMYEWDGVGKNAAFAGPAGLRTDTGGVEWDSICKIPICFMQTASNKRITPKSML